MFERPFRGHFFRQAPRETFKQPPNSLRTGRCHFESFSAKSGEHENVSSSFIFTRHFWGVPPHETWRSTAPESVRYTGFGGLGNFSCHDNRKKLSETSIQIQRGAHWILPRSSNLGTSQMLMQCVHLWSQLLRGTHAPPPLNHH